ncbi:putative calpain-9-like [Brachionus plicatilis]|uniref:Putative calpain-9-like n=1 Tax=Brachionus plicatilis TaxID=10195 RepID=A0A3M7SIJ3_BRAPC|nr:putative calpain-9-like [Brachionus plicatilis]
MVKFIDKTANANDLNQGYLGNCWFIAGCAAITFMSEQFDNVVPKNQTYHGNSILPNGTRGVALSGKENEVTIQENGLWLAKTCWINLNLGKKMKAKYG